MANSWEIAPTFCRATEFHLHTRKLLFFECWPEDSLFRLKPVTFLIPSRMTSEPLFELGRMRPRLNRYYADVKIIDLFHLIILFNVILLRKMVLEYLVIVRKYYSKIHFKNKRRYLHIIRS
jgi:hypothetical protein